MTRVGKSKWMISPIECAFSSLADLGKTPTTFSGFKHKISAVFFGQMRERKRFDMYAKIWKKAANK